VSLHLIKIKPSNAHIVLLTVVPFLFVSLVISDAAQGLVNARALYLFDTCPPIQNGAISTSLSDESFGHDVCSYLFVPADTTDPDLCNYGEDCVSYPCLDCQGDTCWHEWKVKRDGDVIYEAAGFAEDDAVIIATVPGTYVFECTPKDWDPNTVPGDGQGETGQMETVTVNIPDPSAAVDKSSITQCETTGAYLVPDPASCQPYTWYQLSGFDVAVVSGGGQVIPLKTGGGTVTAPAMRIARPRPA